IRIPAGISRWRPGYPFLQGAWTGELYSLSVCSARRPRGVLVYRLIAMGCSIDRAEADADRLLSLMRSGCLPVQAPAAGDRYPIDHQQRQEVAHGYPSPMDISRWESFVRRDGWPGWAQPPIPNSRSVAVRARSHRSLGERLALLPAIVAGIAKGSTTIST